jgi:transposase-like protein
MTAGDSHRMRNLQSTDSSREWTEHDARLVLAQWQQSGTTLAAFARAQGMSAPRLYWWRRRLQRPKAVARALTAAVATLVPAKVVARVDSGAAVTIRLPSGVEIEISNASPSWLAAMVAEMARAA